MSSSSYLLGLEFNENTITTGNSIIFRYCRGYLRIQKEYYNAAR